MDCKFCAWQLGADPGGGGGGGGGDERGPLRLLVHTKAIKNYPLNIHGYPPSLRMNFNYLEFTVHANTVTVFTCSYWTQEKRLLQLTALCSPLLLGCVVATSQLVM